MRAALLDRLGYTVIVAKNGDAAMSALDTHGSRIDLMLTDVVLQGMNGRELYARAAKAYPKLKVLYMSGYSDDIIAHHRVLEQGMNFIEKPFLARDLAKKISQVLRPEEA
jgi:two-component system, cell cycle sensor histidine kinase and response regulator CckA